MILEKALHVIEYKTRSISFALSWAHQPASDKPKPDFSDLDLKLIPLYSEIKLYFREQCSLIIKIKTLTVNVFADYSINWHVVCGSKFSYHWFVFSIFVSVWFIFLPSDCQYSVGLCCHTVDLPPFRLAIWVQWWMTIDAHIYSPGQTEHVSSPVYNLFADWNISEWLSSNIHEKVV